MNLLLLEHQDVVAEGRARIAGRRARHVHDVLRLVDGDTIRVGIRGGRIGTGTVVGRTSDTLEIEYRLVADPPPPPPVVLVVALPRPPMARRILQHVTSFGVKTIVLVQAERVEKSYWNSAMWRPEAIESELVLGLEQAMDTVLPTVVSRRRFADFFREDLPGFDGRARRLLADTAAEAPVPCDVREPTIFVVGPEGGFVPREIETFVDHGFTAVGLGARVLRVDAAVVAGLGRLCGGGRS